MILHHLCINISGRTHLNDYSIPCRWTRLEGTRKHLSSFKSLYLSLFRSCSLASHVEYWESWRPLKYLDYSWEHFDYGLFITDKAHHRVAPDSGKNHKMFLMVGMTWSHRESRNSEKSPLDHICISFWKIKTHCFFDFVFI